MGLIRSFDATDVDIPLEIGERVWWVGHHQEDDAFQCHVYLIEHGDQSILFDPGSVLTFTHTLRKIEQVIPFRDIRYFVCHHQDPDITAALPIIDSMVTREDAMVVTHWRTKTLVRHYGIHMPFWLVEDHEWRLDLGGERTLRFVFTPYAHFPGAICTFDERTGILFSSDIFGGFTEGFSLVAKDESYFEAMRPFHEHYMPSRDILLNALLKMEELPVRMIAPQHGSIIPEELVDFMFKKLKGLDCGLYLLVHQHSDVRRLSQLNRALRDITETMIIYRDFQDMASALLAIAQRLLPAHSLEFFARMEMDDGRVLHLSPSDRYHGVLVEPPALIAKVMASDRGTWWRKTGAGFTVISPEHAMDEEACEGCGLLLPLFAPERGTAQAVAIIHLNEAIEITEEVAEIIDQMSIPLQVAVERESIYRGMDMERERFYERSIRDPLTGLFTRLYMQDSMQRLMGIHDRDENARIAVVMIDIDHFKSINDTYGHNQGDVVLRRVAECLRGTARSGDLPVRLGGEEFGIFVMGESAAHIAAYGERLRLAVSALVFEEPMTDRPVTISVGVAIRRQKETLTDFIHRADTALYEAKHTGRNRVCMAA